MNWLLVSAAAARVWFLAGESGDVDAGDLFTSAARDKVEKHKIIIKNDKNNFFSIDTLFC
jgi:hypothetical protein